MYQALYRKWRPRVFDDVVAQPHVTDTLKNEVATGKLTHAYLFTGSRGTGKTTCAKIFAKAVNCENPQNGNPCLCCPTCLGIEEGRILDVVEQDAASNNGVDAVRALKEETNFTPVSAKYRVYILDEVHMLSISAVNALLKIMEEPPPHVLFILATTEVHKIPETLLSRCQRFDFHRVPMEAIAARLTHIATSEDAVLQPDAAARIASLVNGGMRDAISLLDQALAVSREVAVETVDRVAGVADRAHLRALVEAIQTGNAESIFTTIDALYQRSFDMDRLCGDLHSYFRDLMLCKTCKKPDTLVSTPSELDTLQQLAAGFTLPDLLHGMTALQEAQLRIGRAVSARAELEGCLLRLTDPRLDTTPEGLLRRLEQLESRLAAAGTVAAPAPAAAAQKPAVAAEPPRPAAPAPAAPPTEAPRFAVPSFVTSPVAPAAPAPAAPTPPATPTPVPPAPPAAPAPKPAPQPPVERPVQPSVERPAQQKAPTGGEPTPIDAALWERICETVRERNQPFGAMLVGTTGYTDGGRVLVAGTDAFFDMMRASEMARTSLKEAIRQCTGRAMSIGPYKPKTEETAIDRFERLAQAARERGIDIDV